MAALMPDEKSVWIALIRGIGPATHKLLPMSKLRTACEGAGFGDVRTILATGNLIISSSEGHKHVREVITGILESAGLENEVLLRQPDDFRRIVAANPFSEATAQRPSKVLVLFLAESPEPAAASDLCKYQGPERVAATGREVFIDYVNGVAGSKLIPALVERRLARSATARNWNTILRLSKVDG